MPITGTWTAPAIITNANLEILSTSTRGEGNDFGIDCIQFIECILDPTSACDCDCGPQYSSSGEDLVENGDFSAGDDGSFTSDYDPWVGIPPTMLSGEYSVGNNASLLNAWTGTGMGGSINFLICNGYTTANKYACGDSWKKNKFPRNKRSGSWICQRGCFSYTRRTMGKI